MKLYTNYDDPPVTQSMMFYEHLTNTKLDYHHKGRWVKTGSTHKLCLPGN